MSAHLKISLEDINVVTNDFADANCIGEEFLGKTYKGKLLVSGELIDIAARRIKHSFWLQDRAFEKEISILSGLKHKNIVSIVGFCHEDNELVIVNKRVAHGRLRKHLSDPSLTWMRRLQISVGAASALSYLHDDVGKNSSIIHHNVNSDTILLDENWEAKISGFEYSMSIPSGGLDLAYEKLGIGTYKSDVFSIGVVLFELLCGREAFVSKDNNCFQPSLAIFHYVNGRLHKLVHPDLFSQMDLLSFNIFMETAYYCVTLHEAPPTMNQVLERLEKALEVQRKHENNEHSTVAGERILPEHLKLKLKSLEHMRIPLDDIILATGDFSKGCIVSTGGYGSVHEAELDHVDKEYCCAMQAENGRELPKKRSKVAIKRIFNKKDEMAEQGFYVEIEMLTSCKHSNIINLLGFCEERGEMILIYEYASNGSLNEYIRKKSEIHNDTWAQRVKICLDVAKGLSYLHTAEGDRQEIVHRDIKSANILLDEHFTAKIGDFGLSVFLSDNKEQSTLYSRKTAGTPMYKDPQYIKDAKLKKELDVYSFGVVLFEILCGTLAFETKYLEKNKGLAFVARENFQKETTKQMVDPKIIKEITETIFNSVEGPNQESIDTFTKIAYKCLAEAQADRPTMETVIKKLKKALFYEEKRKEILQIPFKDIRLATDKFSYKNLINRDRFWQTYKGEVSGANGNTTDINVKRFIHDDGFDLFNKELEFLKKYEHENIVGLLGYCVEEKEKEYIIVYKQALSRNLDRHLKDVGLNWGKRLKICIDIASGLDFLHGGSQTGNVVIHGDIQGENILLDADMNAKISNFLISVVHPVDMKPDHPEIIEGTEAYGEPEYWLKGSLSKECDIYSFGIVLFEILLQVFAFELDNENEYTFKGPLIKHLYENRKLDEMMFKGKNEDIMPHSLTIFRRLAIQCLHENRKERPTARELMIQLKEALEIQEKGMNVLKISFEDIEKATDHFKKMIGNGGVRKVFEGQLRHANGEKTIAVKQWDKNYGNRDTEFNRELKILFNFKHKNIIGLEGYCDEMDERIIVYEYASNGSLDKWLNKTGLTWMKRLKICIDVANGLNFLHENVFRPDSVIHGDVRSANILLTCYWEAKITNFKLSLISLNNQEEVDYVIDEKSDGTPGYIDPTCINTSSISKAADIYSLGVVLFEVFCGRLAREDKQESLGPLAKNYYEQYKLDELVFEGIKEQIEPQSFSTFANIAYNCLHDDRHKRPTTSEVVAKLKEAFEFQVDFEIWEPKLPKDYKEIIQKSHNPMFYETKWKKEIYETLCQGILIQEGEVLFSLDGNNQRNEMISAKLFSYKNQSALKWIQYKKSRFKRVMWMMDISSLMIEAHIKAQFLSPSVLYGVYLVFKFVEPNKISSEPKYVNLKYQLRNEKYKQKNETLHAYFATPRKDEWLMIELYRFVNQNEVGNFEILLESFSRYYCGTDAIYVEGIEFRAIDNVTHEEIESSHVQQIGRSNSNIGQTQPIPGDNYGMFLPNSPKYHYEDDVNGKKCLLVSAKFVVFDNSMMQPFKTIIPKNSRFPRVIQVLSQQVCRITDEMHSEFLSSDTDYRCYLIFKLPKRCDGLRCPVKVRHRNNKETKAVYFKSPDPWNIHDINQVPKRRADKWMEVNVWNFNSKEVVKYDQIRTNLKLISYEGTMSGLIVNGIEFRPI